MNYFSLIKGKSQEISPWPHIMEFSKMKIQSVKADSFVMEENRGVRFMYVLDGKYYWTIENQTFTVFPNDLVVIFPGQLFGSLTGSFEVGTFFSLRLEVDFQDQSELRLGDWSNITESEQRLISQILSQKDQSIIPNFKLFGELASKVESEMFANEVGYKTKINNLLDDIWIWTARQMSKNENQGRIFPQTFHRLDQMLRENLAHPWTVEEMAAIIGLGTTTFTEKVKAFSGFPPLNYLINLRISEAIRLMKNSDKSLTDIALDTGFYSSQHFSTTFKKLTGYTPGHFRKNK
ncbi:AraC family transcriptional regulator [Lacihabitans soyangensis]|uniref:AraC family transcriptional regulator n=1 Tax=Lacihabitans soyangensis TaxID=869394 RepID=A0AAE3GZN6_9BACT|nr:AraC family transcriptional regulator [Lacihabitans soyangensis]MCP9762208.1 AraC family transcriptional regulator [Lacihabitans soyangensis]